MVTKKTGYVCLFSFCAIALSSSARIKAQTPTLTVDAASGQHVISPNIYGIANYGLDATFADEIKVPNIRWGGDGATRYNWEVDSSNSGFDWYFTGGNGLATPTPGGQVDTMVKTYQPAGAGALVTIPIIPYVNKSSAYSCSFPTSTYGAQQATNPYVHPNGTNCGNSIATSGTQLTDTNILANHIANSTALQKSWVEHLVARFGTAAKGGVPYYQLDNEPYGWSNTHRDVEPTTVSYPTLVSLGEQYAAAIKQADATAKVFGPSDFGAGGWIGTTSQQNGLMAGQYYLQQMAAYEKANGTRVLDYFDEHYYPSFTDATSQLASTRTLWDPNYNSGSWEEKYYFNGAMELIPRFQSWISSYYPGTKLSLSEYSIDSGNKLITDALAEADVLGIFGRQSLDFANMWTAPGMTDPIAYAFRLYRNYDGNGSQFGGTSVEASSSNQSALSIYGAERSSDGALTMVVINKTTAAIQTTLAIQNFTNAGAAEIYSYSSANLTQIVSGGKVSLASNALSYNFPAYSATIFVVGGSTATSEPIVNGTYRIQSVVSGDFLDDPQSTKVAGTQIDQYTGNGGENQRWTFSYANGYYTIMNDVSGLFLTDPATTGESTGKLLEEPLTLSSGQMWSITGSAGNYVLHNKATGLVIADPGSSLVRYTMLVTEKQTGGSNESWVIE